MNSRKERSNGVQNPNGEADIKSSGEPAMQNSNGEPGLKTATEGSDVLTAAKETRKNRIGLAKGDVLVATLVMEVEYFCLVDRKNM